MDNNGKVGNGKNIKELKEYQRIVREAARIMKIVEKVGWNSEKIKVELMKKYSAQETERLLNTYTEKWFGG